jgi:hypothetical protein
MRKVTLPKQNGEGDNGVYNTSASVASNPTHKETLSMRVYSGRPDIPYLSMAVNTEINQT